MTLQNNYLHNELPRHVLINKTSFLVCLIRALVLIFIVKPGNFDNVGYFDSAFLTHNMIFKSFLTMKMKCMSNKDNKGITSKSNVANFLDENWAIKVTRVIKVTSFYGTLVCYVQLAFSVWRIRTTLLWFARRFSLWVRSFSRYNLITTKKTAEHNITHSGRFLLVFITIVRTTGRRLNNQKFIHFT